MFSSLQANVVDLPEQTENFSADAVQEADWACLFGSGWAVCMAKS